MLTWQQTEFIFKGVYLGILAFVALQLRPETWWIDIGQVAFCTFVLLIFALLVAAFRKLREGYRVRGRARKLRVLLVGFGGPGGGAFGQGKAGGKDINPSELANKALNDAAALEQADELMKSREEIKADQKNPQFARTAGEEGPSVSYHLTSRVTIPSRKDEQVIEVTKCKLEPKYYYKAVPVLNRHVYRLADVVNTSKMILLPGEATMYQGNDFVGRMSMPIVAIGEEFTAGFGVDPQLQISRLMLDKTRNTQGGNQLLKYDYRILVNSYKTEKIKLQVWDRLPFADAETLGINLVKATPELSKDALYVRDQRPNNLLRWDLDVEPNTNGERATAINYEFRLDLDRQMVISNFLTR